MSEKMSSRTDMSVKRLRAPRREEKSSVWTILGESSIILALVTTTLYLIGWTYESNWYAYFGISTSQVDIPLPQILIRSLPIIVLSIFLVFVIYVFVSFYAKLRDILSRPHISEQNKLKLTLAISPLGIWLYSFVTFPFLPSKDLLAMIRQLPLQGIYASYGGLLILVAFLYISIPNLWFSLRKLQPIENTFISTLDKIPLPILIAVLSGINLITILFMSTAVATVDAQNGREGLSVVGIIQRVYLVSPKSLDFTNEFDVSICYDKACIYGPLGLIAENSNSYFLINMNTQQTNFSRNPGIYEIPRSDQEGSYYVVPASRAILLPTATLPLPPTNTFVPPTNSAMSTHQPIVSPTAVLQNNIATSTP